MAKIVDFGLSRRDFDECALSQGGSEVTTLTHSMKTSHRNSFDANMLFDVNKQLDQSIDVIEKLNRMDDIFFPQTGGSGTSDENRIDSKLNDMIRTISAVSKTCNIGTEIWAAPEQSNEK